MPKHIHIVPKHILFAATHCAEAHHAKAHCAEAHHAKAHHAEAHSHHAKAHHAKAHHAEAHSHLAKLIFWIITRNLACLTVWAVPTGHRGGVQA